MVDYGNARVAALRSRLLDREALHRLGEATSADDLLVRLERFDDWHSIVRELSPLATRPVAVIELAIERHRSARLGGLLSLYGPPARALVEALVLPLDLERALEVLRRRRAGEPPESVVESVTPGALLDTEAIVAIARARDVAHAVRLLGRFGLITPARVADLVRAGGRSVDAPALEARLLAAADDAREARIVQGGVDADLVRAAVAGQRADREAVAAELVTVGPAGAAELERTLALARFDDLVAQAHRDPLGIGPVAGYVAAVEAQAIRLRAVLARVADAWSRERTGVWLAAARS